MRADPFTNPDDDGGEPDGSQGRDDFLPRPVWPDPDLPDPGIGLLADGEDAGAAEQGLFLSVPAGSLDPGRFAQCGPAGDMPPDPLLATIIDLVTGPDGAGV